MKPIFYKQGYKYQLVEDCFLLTAIFPAKDISSDFITLSQTGLLTIKKGYAWDGPSAIAIDTLNFMRASLLHDALYQLMRTELLSKELFRKDADQLLFDICVADGMSRVRAKLAYYAVRLLGDSFADSKSRKEVLIAPE